MTHDEFRQHYKVLYGDMIIKDIDEKDLRMIAAATLTYINLKGKYEDYMKYKLDLKKHLMDFDIIMSMGDERNEE